MVDVHTVGAGGGSIGWADAGGALRVGPRSAGAVPGPACYGRGGQEPTVTDANLLLGYLGADAPLAGGVRSTATRPSARCGGSAERLGLSMRGDRARDRARRRRRRCCARCASRPSSAASTRAATRSSRSEARARCTPLASREELEIRRVLCPRAAGVLSALGLAIAEPPARRRPHRPDVARPTCEPGAPAAVAAELAGRRGRGLSVTRRRGLIWDVRYAGQAFELPVEAPAGAAACRSCASCSSARTPSATATPIRTARSRS